MAISVGARPNYYELLGLAPTAAGEEVTRAFVRAFSVFRPRGQQQAAELSVAYETLRDPIKRRRYDAALGLRDAPKRAPEPLPIIPPPAPDRQFRINPVSPHRFDLAGQLEAETMSIGWKKVAAGVGVVVLSACLIGAGAGWWSGREAGQIRAAEPVPAVAETPTEPEPVTPIPPSSPRQLADKAPPRPIVASRIARAPKVRVAESQPVSSIAPAQEQADPVVTETTAAEAPTPTTASALPLPNRVIARTIERIGYSCGNVASTSPVDGAAGVFRINCTSGQSYQAAPVNGRYRFRRLRGQ